MKQRTKEIIFRISLFISGLINLIPLALAFLPRKIGESYGIEVPDQNLELLLRHRAILFGIVGGIMIYSAISKKNYALAALIGFVSMISFVILSFFVGGEINPELSRVMQIDYIGIAVLAVGLLIIGFKTQSSDP